jgi:hypothetical protein
MDRKPKRRHAPGALISRLLSRRRSPGALQAELDRPDGWMYPWEIDGRTAVLMHPELPSVHETRREMIAETVKQALRDAGPGARALDIACSEGWFSQRLLEWGAETVLGVDVRESNVRRAELVRDHFGISPSGCASRAPMSTTSRPASSEPSTSS